MNLYHEFVGRRIRMLVERDDAIKLVPFANLDLSDSFFDSLRTAYNGAEFDRWFQKKALSNENTWVVLNHDEKIQAMLYLKKEDGKDDDVTPPLTGKRLKIGTFKVDFSHHTSVGKRLLAIALRAFAKSSCEYAYVTMFEADNTESLRKMLSQYGFTCIAKKNSTVGSEDVWIKRRPSADEIGSYSSFPFVMPRTGQDYVLSIWPKYHVRMFGDVSLRSEKDIPVPDTTSINTIEKTYLSKSPMVSNMRLGDRVVIYRTSDGQSSARYRSVVSSVRTVMEVKNLSCFYDKNEFLSYVKGRSVFSQDELENFWTSQRFPWVMSLLFNFPLNRYPTRGELLDRGLIPEGRLACTPISGKTFRKIIELGGVDEGYIVD
ncbi:hypothetical protein [Bifidobacterium longum]|uniref:hypothetical protein n=1 Tax=Bifidobacterium longum TaxID=216816 RepID=UPI00103FD134|nr:hypothetical protein [Bifidobacterium longum]